MKCKNILFFMLCLATNSAFATPANLHSVKDLLKLNHLDQTLQLQQDTKYADYAATTFIIGVNSGAKQNYDAHIPELSHLIHQYLNTPEFKAYYEQQLAEPFLQYFEEEELIHLIQIAEQPLAQDFYRQMIKSIQDRQAEVNIKEQAERTIQTEQYIQKLLDTL